MVLLCTSELSGKDHAEFCDLTPMSPASKCAASTCLQSCSCVHPPSGGSQSPLPGALCTCPRGSSSLPAPGCSFLCQLGVGNASGWLCWLFSWHSVDGESSEVFGCRVVSGCSPSVFSMADNGVPLSDISSLYSFIWFVGSCGCYFLVRWSEAIQQIKLSPLCKRVKRSGVFSMWLQGWRSECLLLSWSMMTHGGPLIT